MDPNILRHYRAEQRPPVFGRRGGAEPTRSRPLWPLLIYGAILGFITVVILATLLQHL